VLSWRPAPDCWSASFEDGEVILCLRTGRYFQLNRTAQAIWKALRVGRTTPAIVEELCDRFDCSPARALADVLALCRRLQAEGLAVPATAP
jgi:hypothetical protein